MNIRNWLDNSKKLILTFIVTTVIIYGAFWLSYYFLSTGVAVAVSVSVAASFGILFAVFHKKTWAAVIYTVFLSAAIGIAISIFFIASKTVPSKFFGLVLLVMLVYKTSQAVVGRFIKKKKVYNIIFIVCMVLEVIGIIISGIYAFKDAGFIWQIFFALLLCFFYSCAQMALRNRAQDDFWRNVAIAYLLGFVYIFLIIILLIISIVSEDGTPMEILFEGLGEGLAGGLDSTGTGPPKVKKHNRLR